MMQALENLHLVRDGCMTNAGEWPLSTVKMNDLPEPGWCRVCCIG